MGKHPKHILSRLHAKVLEQLVVCALHVRELLAQLMILLVPIVDLGQLGRGLEVERTQTPVNLLQDAPVANGLLVFDAVVQFAILVLEAGDFVTEALVGGIDVLLVLGEVIKLSSLFCKFLVDAVEAQIVLNNPVLLILKE